MKTTMVEGWPDAIRCSSDPSGKGGSIFIVHWASIDSETISSYRQVYSGEDRFVEFNADGTYQGRGGNVNASAECVGKSIKQLYSEGRAFNFVSSIIQDNLGMTSIVANWPDAIRCSSDPSKKGGGSIFIIWDRVGSDSEWYPCYRQVYGLEDRFVSFSRDGSYLGRGGDDYSSAECAEKSIKQLYSEERAFNFVSSKVQDNFGMTSIVPN